MEYYSRYGLSLKRVNRCNEAVQVAQAMIQTLPDDDTAIFNAEKLFASVRKLWKMAQQKR